MPKSTSTASNRGRDDVEMEAKKDRVVVPSSSPRSEENGDDEIAAAAAAGRERGPRPGTTEEGCGVIPTREQRNRRSRETLSKTRRRLVIRSDDCLRLFPRRLCAEGPPPKRWTRRKASVCRSATERPNPLPRGSELLAYSLEEGLLIDLKAMVAVITV